jgi:hypothetical protein
LNSCYGFNKKTEDLNTAVINGNNGMKCKPLLMKLRQTDEYQPLLEGKPATHGMRSGRVHLKPDDCCGEHSTKAHEEQRVFLSGQEEAQCGPEQEKMVIGHGANPIHACPHGAQHG